MSGLVRLVRSKLNKLNRNQQQHQHGVDSHLLMASPSLNQLRQHKDMVKAFSTATYGNNSPILKQERGVIDQIKVLFNYYRDYLKVSTAPVLRFHLRNMFATSINHSIGLVNSTHFALENHSTPVKNAFIERPYTYVGVKEELIDHDSSITGIYSLEMDFRVSSVHDRFYHFFHTRIPPLFLRYNELVTKNITEYVNAKNDLRVILSSSSAQRVATDTNISKKMETFHSDLQALLSEIGEMVENLKEQLLKEMKKVKTKYRDDFAKEATEMDVVKRGGLTTSKSKEFHLVKGVRASKALNDSSAITLHFHPEEIYIDGDDGEGESEAEVVSNGSSDLNRPPIHRHKPKAKSGKACGNETRNKSLSNSNVGSSPPSSFCKHLHRSHSFQSFDEYEKNILQEIKNHHCGPKTHHSTTPTKPFTERTAVVPSKFHDFSPQCTCHDNVEDLWDDKFMDYDEIMMLQRNKNERSGESTETEEEAEESESGKTA